MKDASRPDASPTRFHWSAVEHLGYSVKDVRCGVGMGKSSWVIHGSLKVAELDFGSDTTMLNLRHAIAELPGIPGWAGDFDMLLIISDESSMDTFTPDSMKAHQTFMRAWNERYRQGHAPKTALVCASDLKRIIPELWSAMTRENWKTQIGVFTNRAEALDWLGQPAE